MDEWIVLLEAVGKSWHAAGAPSRVTAAVSGGADSMALLAALRELALRESIFLTAAHVDHGLREASGRDAAFVRGICESWGVPCQVRQVQIDGKSEDAARQARYRALAECCRENGASFLALAHHQRDQAETLLLHLFRGSGSAGLAGMKEMGRRSVTEKNDLCLWRPLLSLSPDCLRAALKSRGIPWVEDETNARDNYLRNYIRHQVLPAVSARFPKAEEAMGRAARILADEDDYFYQEANAFLSEKGNACLRGPCIWLGLAQYMSLKPALRRHVLRLACPVPLDWETTQRLMDLSPGRIINLPQGFRAECTSSHLHFIQPGKLETPTPEKSKLTAVPFTGKTGDGIRAQAMKKSVWEQAELRFLRPGDRIRPLGAGGEKSMQDYFVDKKVPRPFRRFTPLLCIGSQVIWVIGTGVGEEARISPRDDCVFVMYAGYLPQDPAAETDQK